MDPIDHYQVAVQQYQRGELDAARVSFRQHLSANPSDWNGHIGLGVVLEQRGRLQDAIRCYLEAVRLHPDPQHHFNIGAAYRRLRHQGGLDREIEQYEAAIRLRPDYAPAWQGLADARIHQGRYADAREAIGRAIAIDPGEPRFHHLLARTHFFAGDAQAAWRCFDESNRLAIERWDGDLDRNERRSPRRWFARPEHAVEIPSHHTGRSFAEDTARGPDKTGAPVPALRNRQQAARLVTLRNVYLEGLHGYVYDDQRVYVGDHVRIQGVWRFFNEAPPEHPRNDIAVGKLASLHQPDVTQYYHWTAEALVRLLLLEELLERDSQVRLLVPSTQAPRFVDEYLELLGVGESRLIRNRPSHRNRYFAEELYYIEWDRPLPEQGGDEVASVWVPPRDGLLRLRERLATPFASPSERRTVVYTSRAGAGSVRAVVNEAELIAALRAEVGDDLFVFDGDGMSVREQIEVFRGARLVVGPHGAALTNILWCSPGAAVVELPVVPRVLNHFAHMALALDLSYRAVPEASAPYQGRYEIDARGVDAVVRTVRKALGELDC
jgi:hypothetical protein